MPRLGDGIPAFRTWRLEVSAHGSTPSNELDYLTASRKNPDYGLAAVLNPARIRYWKPTAPKFSSKKVKLIVVLEVHKDIEIQTRLPKYFNTHRQTRVTGADLHRQMGKRGLDPHKQLQGLMFEVFIHERNPLVMHAFQVDEAGASHLPSQSTIEA